MTDHQHSNSEPDDNRVDPGAICQAEFETWIGSDFTIPIEDTEPLILRLEAVEKSQYQGVNRPNGDASYSLLFSGPMERYFHQATVPLHLPDGRACSLLAVNNGPQDGRMRYQVVFN